jgi:hypothetical protein
MTNKDRRIKDRLEGESDRLREREREKLTKYWRLKKERYNNQINTK